jgi:hypothetical protein
VVASGALVVDGVRQALFAGAGFALEEDGGVGGGNDLDLPQHVFEGRAFADDLLTMVCSSEPFPDTECYLS